MFMLHYEYGDLLSAKVEGRQSSGKKPRYFTAFVSEYQ
jgi:hypothetical protein